MKYSSTVRMVNVVLFALLLAGFAFLGIWFGFLVTPYQWIGGRGSPLSTFPSMSFGLSALLGVLGLAGAIVSLGGLVCAVRSVIRGNDDRPVLQSFGCYIAIGFVLCAFLFLSATWLYRLTSSNIGDDDLGFIITVYVVAFIIVAFATLLPLSKIFGDNDRYNEIMKIISFSMVAIDFAIALVYFLAYLQVASYRSGVSYSGQVMVEFGSGALFPFIACVLACLSFLGYSRAEKKNIVSKGNGFLFEGALLVNGGSIIAAGIIEQIFQTQELRISLMAKGIGQVNPTYSEFAIMSYIVGGVIILASLYFMYQTALGSKAKVVKED